MRSTDMPELPEVETVRRQLEKTVIGEEFLNPIINYPRMIKSDISSFSKTLSNKKIEALSRRGKFLILNLSDDYNLIFHLRMEGKLFHLKKIVDKNHLSLLMPLKDGTYLAFYDVRKFGICYLGKKDDVSIFNNLGPEPYELNDPSYLLSKYKSKHKCIKEVLLDQSIMSGLGNIYADEVLFSSSISPFKLASSLSLEECQKILDNSKKILFLAIQNNGSTIKSYQASASLHGSFQDFLKVYSKAGTLCPKCHNFKIEKRKLAGRSTSFCPNCQHVGISIAITGKIATGKSLALSYFQKLGYKTFSCDEEVRKLYLDQSFLRQVKEDFPFLFTPDIDKQMIAKLLVEDKKFNKAYNYLIHKIIKERVDKFLNENDSFDKAVEVPLLFDAKMEKMFTFILGMDSSKQLDHLLERGDKNIEKRLSFNNINNFEKNKDKLDYLIYSDFSKEELFKKIKKIAEDISAKKTTLPNL